VKVLVYDSLQRAKYNLFIFYNEIRKIYMFIILQSVGLFHLIALSSR
jgi:hypothetical protein